MNPFYFGSSEAPLFGAYHPPLTIGATEAAVLICPTLGREYMRTHWSLRRLADQLARAGLHVLRFDYFGTGDSAGQSGDGTVERWHTDIRTAANELLELSGVSRISIVGLRAGAALAATTEDMEIQDLVLWDPIIDGRDYINDLRHLHQAKLEAYNQIRRKPLEETPNELLGFPFPSTMQDSIKKIDLLSDFNYEAENIFIFSSENSQSLSSLIESVNSHGCHCNSQIIDDPGYWDQASASGKAYLPNAILVAIVDALTGK